MSAKLIRITSEIYPAHQGVVVSYESLDPTYQPDLTAPPAYGSEHHFRTAFSVAGIHLRNELPTIQENRNGVVITIKRFEAAATSEQLRKLGYHQAGSRL